MNFNLYIQPITYSSFRPENMSCPVLKSVYGSNSVATRIENKIEAIHKAGLEAYYFTDIIVLPKRLVEIYKNEICDATGRIDFTRPKTQEIHRIMLQEIFKTFPET